MVPTAAGCRTVSVPLAAAAAPSCFREPPLVEDVMVWEADPVERKLWEFRRAIKKG